MNDMMQIDLTAAAPAIEGEHVLRVVAEGIANVRGEEFFRVLTRLLAQALGFRVAFASEFVGDRERVRTLAFWDRDGFLENFEYALEHTPCEQVLQGSIGYFPDRVQDRFPGHREGLASFNAESYIAIPMVDQHGEVLGHLAAMDERPMRNAVRELSVLQILGCRAALELERARWSAMLENSERRLNNVLQTATDAILAVNAGHHITLFNRGAEKVFRCSADWAIGQPLERFLSRKSRAVLDQYLGGHCEAAREGRALWAPEGLCGLRADGAEFPIEATFSPMELDGQLLHTVILRDVNERERAYRQLRRLQTEHEDLQEVMRREQEFEGLIGSAPEMRRLLSQVHQVAATSSTVLITGETGTGKELIARAIHGASPRAERTLVSVNCAALPSELIESELFGHERGAFTGATVQRKGRFELAHGGTIFLDEVGELSAQAQAKLLRALQEQCFERVGGTHPIRVDVRVVAATNRDLQDMVNRGEFRADLFYRLNVFPVCVPPLRERRVDIEPLARFFLEKFARKLGKDLKGFLPVSLERLRRYNWPGNVRELQNLVERAAILSTGPLVEVMDPLPGHAGGEDPSDDQPPVSATAEDVMRKHFLRTLDDCDWIIEGPKGAAAILDMKPSTLRYRMKQLDIRKHGTRAR